MEGKDEDRDPTGAAAGGGVLTLLPGGGPSRPGEGWAHVRITHSADMKASWECNYCKKVVSGENHTRVNDLFIVYSGTKPTDTTKPQVLEHIAGVKGNVAVCTSASEEVRAKMLALLQSKETKKESKVKRESAAAAATEEIVGEAALAALAKRSRASASSGPSVGPLAAAFMRQTNSIDSDALCSMPIAN